MKVWSSQPFDVHCCHYGYSYEASWASECPDVKNYKWQHNPVWHRMLCSCTYNGNSGCQRVNGSVIACNCYVFFNRHWRWVLAMNRRQRINFLRRRKRLLGRLLFDEHWRLWSLIWFGGNWCIAVLWIVIWPTKVEYELWVCKYNSTLSFLLLCVCVQSCPNRLCCWQKPPSLVIES